MKKFITLLTAIITISNPISIFATPAPTIDIANANSSNTDLSSTNAPKKPANAGSDLLVTLKGMLHFQAGFTNQNHLAGDEKNISTHHKNFAFFNEAAMIVNISNVTNEVTYGGKIILVPASRKSNSASYNGSHIFVESEYGKVEAGSPYDAATKMYLDSGEIASAVGGGWIRYAKLDTHYLKQGYYMDPSFTDSSDFFLGSKLLTSSDTFPYSKEPSRKVSYYTPKFEIIDTTKVQLGISYIPDSANTGAANPDKNTTKVEKFKLSENGKNRFELDKNVKDAVSGGLTIEHNITDGVDFKVAVTGEYAKASGDLKQFTDDKPVATYKLKDLRTYNIGSVLSVGNISYAASYGTLGKSLTTRDFCKSGRDTHFYTGAIAYHQGPFSASVSYFQSIQFKNKLDSITVGTDWKIAPGFKPYAEISKYYVKGKPEFYNELQARKTRGTVGLIGAKVSL